MLPDEYGYAGRRSRSWTRTLQMFFDLWQLELANCLKWIRPIKRQRSGGPRRQYMPERPILLSATSGGVERPPVK